MHYISKFVVASGLVILGILTCHCESKQSAEEITHTTESPKLNPLEVEVLKLLNKEDFNRDLIFKQTNNLDLEAKLALVNQLAEKHQIERMNMLKARVQMGIIDNQQKSLQYKKDKQKALEQIDSILREKAKEEGLLKE